MRRVRAFNKETGEFIKNVHASGMNEQTRHAHDYCCLDPSCGAQFHWVKAHSKHENTVWVPDTFARNPGSSHKAGCHYDYEYKHKHNEGLTFFEGGLFHLRINFSLGASWADKHPVRGDLSTAQQRVARNRSRFKGVQDIGQLVKFIEKEFGSLESPALENLVLHYQGQDYPWRDVFVKSESYTRSFNEAAQSTQGRRAKNLTIMKPVREIEPNRNGKRRFECEQQYAHTGKKHEFLTPVIVCDTASAADMVAHAMQREKIMLAAASPFIPQKTLEEPRRKGISCYYNIFNHSQIAEVGNRYWRYHPARQMGFSGFDL